jgi:predicted permease
MQKIHTPTRHNSGSRFWALFSKEVMQLFRNRQLVLQMLMPPTVFDPVRFGDESQLSSPEGWHYRLQQ